MAKLIDLEGLGTFLAKLKSWATAQINSAKSALQTNIDKKVDKTTTVNGHALSGNVTVSKTDVGLGNVTNDAQVKRSEMGAANGVATLDTSGKVPSAQLPSFVDDVLEISFVKLTGTVTVTNSKVTSGTGGVYYIKEQGVFVWYQKTGTATGGDLKETYYAKWGIGENTSEKYGGETSAGVTPAAGKIYVDISTNKTYRWSGSDLVEISSSLALGTTSSTAFRGDYGNTAYQHATKKGAAFSSGLYKITTNDQGHVTAAAAVSKADITALGIPSTNTTYGVATSSSNGLMSSTDKKVLDFIANGASPTNGTGYLRGPIVPTVSTTSYRFELDAVAITTAGQDTTPTGLVINAATSAAAGLMSAADKKKLDGYSVATTAEVEALFD